MLVLDQAVSQPAMTAGTLGGFLFREQDRDGVLETGDSPLAGAYVYLYDHAGRYVRNVVTDSTGWYAFTGLADGTYTAEIAPVSWNPFKQDWVPDTTGSLFPRRTVALSGTARADLGARRIVRSTSAARRSPPTSGRAGLTVKSYDDVVPAREVHDRLAAGTLLGSEAATVTVRFDYASSGLTSSLLVQSNGVYTEYRATSDVTWASWLRGDAELFHEYGHAWSMYYASLTQQDSTLRAYLEARGLAGEPRVGSSYAWEPGEMIAEDYRQLFGTQTAQAAEQTNRDIAPARDVPGLREFLRPPSCRRACTER